MNSRFVATVMVYTQTVLDTVGSDTTHVPGSRAAPQRDWGSDPERPQPGATGSHQTHRW